MEPSISNDTSVQTSDSSQHPSPSPSAPEVRGPPKACIFVARLNPISTEEDLQQIFAEFGEILKIKLIKDTKTSRAYAFVQFKEPEQADMAISQTNGRSVEGRNIKVEKAKVQRTLFIAKIPRTMEEEELRSLVADYGPIEKITIIKNRQSQKSKGCGFVKFGYREDAMEAFEGLKNTQRRWVVEWATSTNEAEAAPSDAFSIFVGGLPLDVTKEEVEQRFSPHGAIDNLTIVVREKPQSEAASSTDSADATSTGAPESADAETSSDQTASPPLKRGSFAFIRFVEPSGAANAIQAENEALWGDRPLRVQYVESSEAKNRRRNSRSNINPSNRRFPLFGQKFDPRNHEMGQAPGERSTNRYDSSHPYDQAGRMSRNNGRGYRVSRGSSGSATGGSSNYSRSSRGSNTGNSRGGSSSTSRGGPLPMAGPHHYPYHHRGSPHMFMIPGGPNIYPAASPASGPKYSYPSVAPTSLKSDLAGDPAAAGTQGAQTPGQTPSFFPPAFGGYQSPVPFGYDRQPQWQFYQTPHYNARGRNQGPNREDHAAPEGRMEIGMPPSAPSFDRSIPFPNRF